MEDEIRALELAMLDDISKNLHAFEKTRSELIPVLQMIQERHAYIAQESIKIVAEYLDLEPCEVYGVATFYNQFRFNPPGKHQIKVCLNGMSC